MKYCGSCGSKLEKESMFCSSCGNKVLNSSENKKNKSKKEEVQNKKAGKSKNDLHFLEKQIHDAGNTGVVLGWLNIIITVFLVLVGSSIGEEFNYTLLDLSIYVPFAIMIIILSSRLKIVKTNLLKKYLNILLGSSIGLIGLSIWAGGGVGWLWILFIFQLYRAIQASNKLFSIDGYKKESNPQFKFKTVHWIALAIISSVLFVIGLQQNQYTPERFREEFMNGCTEEAGYDAWSYCNCAHKYLINRYSIDEIIELDSQPSRADVIYDRVADYCYEYLPAY